jgi:hypothetical protein
MHTWPLLSAHALTHVLSSPQIQPYECIKPPKAGQPWAASITNLIDRFNNVSRWVATEIVLTANMRQRISMVRRFIRLAEVCVRRSPPPDPMQSLVAQTLISSTRCAQELLALNNFNSLLEVLAGLNLAPVQRLKRTWRVWSETVGGGNKCQQTLINSSPTRPTLGSAKCSS